jgi:pseudouridine kinase
MHVAVSDTNALDNMPLSHIIKHQSLIEKSDMIVIDAALPEPIIDHILNIAQKSRIYVDPVSTNKAKSIKGKLSKFDTLKCNALEASYLSDIEINDRLSLELASLELIKQGLSNIFITLGKDGVYYQNKETKGYLPSYAYTIKNATGAGDAFMAGIIYGGINDLSIQESALFASGMSALALDSITAVNPMITVNKVMEIIRNGEKYELK